MKHSKLKYHYTQYFGDYSTIFSGISTAISTAQYRALKLDYAFGSATYKFIRDEKE